MKKLTILHIATAHTWRGGEQQVAYLTVALREQGVGQFVLCSEGSEMEQFCKKENLSFFTSKKGGGFSPAWSKKITQICTAHKIDLIHTHDSHAHSFAIYAAVFFGNPTKIIVSRRVDFPVKGGYLSRFKYNHKSIARILCVSDTIRKITEPAIQDPDKLVTVYSGIDVSRFAGKTNTGILHQEFGIPASVKIIGNVAALAPHKDYFTFVDTVYVLVQQRRDCKFLIIGDGPEKDAIVNYIQDKKLNEHIILTGFRKAIPELLPELDVMLITSETEGLGTAILDAFACRVPVVATAAGGIPELVIHEKTGLLAPVKDPASLAIQVNRVLDDTGLRDTLVNAAWQHLRHFTRESTAEKTLAEYLKIIH